MDTVRLETRYGMADGLTPVLAARIAECASRYRSHVSIESGGRTIRIESLISVAFDGIAPRPATGRHRRGRDAGAAAESLRALLEG